MKSTFSGCHPVVNLIYFTAVIGCAMFFMHPICLFISLLSSVLYSIKLNGVKAIKFSLCFCFPMLLLAAVINPLFNHGGVTILAYFPNGNPLTLESVLYGIAAAVMLAAVISIFSCFNTILTTDKLIYLFGRIIPSLSLVLSMTLRFVPKFAVHFKDVRNAQRCIGRDITNGSLVNRFKNAAAIISIMITWALENAVDTADSMKARGYGLPNRTSFSIYKFDTRDALTLAAILLCTAYTVTGALHGEMYFSYFPTVKQSAFTPYSFSVFMTYFILYVIPLFLEIKEDIKWRTL